MGVFLKARISNIQHIKDILLSLDSRHIKTEYLLYHYFTIDEETVTFLRIDSEGHCIRFICQASEKHSKTTHAPVKDVKTTQEELARRYGPCVSFTKHEASYLLKGVEISLSMIEGLDTFLELETEQYTYEELHTYIRKFGLKESDVVTIPYNVLLQEAERLSTKR